MLLTACEDGPAPPAKTAVRPTGTRNIVAPPTRTAVVAPPGGTVGTSLSPSSVNPGGSVSYKTYTAAEGKWSIDYPSDWTVNQTGSTTQFLGPNAEAFSQVTYSDVGGLLNADALVKTASDNLKKSFGDTYNELKQARQPDGSTRIDFSFDQGAQKYVGQAFVEQRGTGLYLLMLIANPDLADKYDPIFARIVSSYVLPAGAGGPTPLLTATIVIGGNASTPTGVSSNGGPTADAAYKTYAATTGNWSIDYPSTWTVKQIGPTIQFLGPKAEAFSQVTYTEIGAALDPNTVVEAAANSLKSSFGRSYNETKREKQPNGSTRLDFTFEQGGNKFNGAAFVVERGTGLYMLMNVSTPAVAQKYAATFQRIVGSYKVPKP